MLFQELPTEIQLNALSQCQAPSRISKEMDQLTDYIQRSKAKHYLEDNELSLSLFCCQSKQLNQRLIFKLERASRDEYKIGGLLKSENLLPSVNKKNLPFESENHLDLVIDEEVTSLKIYTQLRFNNTVLQDSSVKLQTTELSQSPLSKSVASMDLELQLEKGESEETFGYDFEKRINYTLNVSKIHIPESNLVKLIESEKGEMIIRY